MKYQKRTDGERSTLHWGQLKLLESELKCLLEHFSSTAPSGDRDLVVYAGAAPGAHVLSLLQRFPRCRFKLYDPAAFDQRLLDFAATEEGKARLAIVNDFFNDERAKEVAAEGPKVFFSDIRTADPAQMAEEEVEGHVGRDMVRQKEWAKALQADLSVLKFRLPWGPGTTMYLKGRVLVQTFPPCTSTETRLLVPKKALEEEEVAYDQEEYEEQLMYHNTVFRASLFEHGVDVPGLDGCYDCAALVHTVRRFLQLKSHFTLDNIPSAATEVVSDAAIATEITKLVEEVGQGGRNLALQYHVSSSRHGGRRFARKRFFDEQGKDHFTQEPSSKRLRA